MIGRIKGRLVKKDEKKVYIETGGLCYEVYLPKAVYQKLRNNTGSEIEMVVYYYLQNEKNRSIPVMIGFTDELEREFFEEFISVSGIGPRAALKAFDKPISSIAEAIEEGNVDFLKALSGIGRQKAKQIVASLQGKVGRFVLIKKEEVAEEFPKKEEIIEEARQILKRLQYSTKEVDLMIKQALQSKPYVESVEELLNEIYRQKK